MDLCEFETSRSTNQVPDRATLISPVSRNQTKKKKGIELLRVFIIGLISRLRHRQDTPRWGCGLHKRESQLSVFRILTYNLGDF